MFDTKYKTYKELSIDIEDTTFNFFMVGEMILDSAKPIAAPNHMHGFFEFSYILKGTMQIESEGMVYNIKENDAVLIPENISHKRTISEHSQTITLPFIYINNKNSSKSFIHEFKFLTKQDITVFHNFSGGDAFCRLARYYCANYKEKHHLIRSCLYEIILFAKEFAEENKPADKPFPSDTTLYRNYIIDTYLNSKLADGSISDLSQHLHLSRQQTYRIMKKLYGRSFEECMKETKMENAVQLIEKTELSFAEIAERIGYKNSNNFFRAFKKYYGVTPLYYRKNHISLSANY